MATNLPPGLLDGLRSADPSARLLSVTGLAELVRVSYGAGAAALGLILRESGAVPSLAAILGDGAEARQSALFVLANLVVVLERDLLRQHVVLQILLKLLVVTGLVHAHKVCPHYPRRGAHR